MAKRSQCQACNLFRSVRNMKDGLCNKCYNNQFKYCAVCGKEHYKHYKGFNLCREHHKALKHIQKPTQIQYLINQYKRAGTIKSKASAGNYKPSIYK